MIGLKQKMTIGPKGQVVIPKSIREVEQIFPGEAVIVETTENGILIKKIEPEKDPIEVFREIAFSGKKISAKDIDMHGYEEQLDERFTAAILANKKVKKI